jgi:hypothetical protein
MAIPRHEEPAFPSAPDANEVNFYQYRGRWHGLASWIFSTDHKKIGLMYLTLMLIYFTVGMSLGFLIRLELFKPGQTIVGPQTYNALFTMHGVIMIFLFVIPGLSASMGNFVLPIMIGAKDVQFPRINLLSWWLFVFGAIFAVMALLTGGGPPDTGWTFYAPYSIRTGTNVTMAAFAVFVLGFSSILTGLNFVTTIHRMRAPGMTFLRMPLFVWAVYATGWLQVVATPIIGITLVLIMVERTFGIGVFDPVKGGDPILYQHLFWIYSHPAVYIMILPGLGAISEVITVHSRRTMFGYTFIAMSSLAIALFGTIVWAHHMFVSGNSLVANFVFSLLTMIVAIPSAVKVFNWVATLYKGSIQLEDAHALRAGVHLHLHDRRIHRHDDRRAVRRRARARYLLHRGTLPLHPVRRTRLCVLRRAAPLVPEDVREDVSPGSVEDRVVPDHGRLQRALHADVHPRLGGHAAALLGLPAAVHALAPGLDGGLVDHDRRHSHHVHQPRALDQARQDVHRAESMGRRPHAGMDGAVAAAARELP